MPISVNSIWLKKRCRIDTFQRQLNQAAHSDLTHWYVLERHQEAQCSSHCTHTIECSYQKNSLNTFAGGRKNWKKKTTTTTTTATTIFVHRRIEDRLYGWRWPPIWIGRNEAKMNNYFIQKERKIYSIHTRCEQKLEPEIQSKSQPAKALRTSQQSHGIMMSYPNK